MLRNCFLFECNVFSSHVPADYGIDLCSINGLNFYVLLAWRQSLFLSPLHPLSRGLNAVETKYICALLFKPKSWESL